MSGKEAKPRKLELAIPGTDGTDWIFTFYITISDTQPVVVKWTEKSVGSGESVFDSPAPEWFYLLHVWEQCIQHAMVTAFAWNNEEQPVSR